MFSRSSSKAEKCLFAGVVIVAIFMLGVIVTGLPGKAHCATGTSVTLAWNANPEPDIAGYKVYYGTVKGTYATKLNVGNYTGCVISGLSSGKTYYFVATAYDKYGLESNYSTVLSYTVPALSNTNTSRTYASTTSGNTR